MPARPNTFKYSLALEKRLGRNLSDEETIRLGMYARALRLRRCQQRIYKPRMELWDDGESPLVTAVFELPGLRSDEVRVDVVDGRLLVSGERRQTNISMTSASTHDTALVDAADGYVTKSETERQGSLALRVQEVKYGFFRRVVPVSVGCTTSDLAATMENGMLTVSWPRQPHALPPSRYHEKADEPDKGREEASEDVAAPRFQGVSSSRSM